MSSSKHRGICIAGRLGDWTKTWRLSRSSGLGLPIFVSSCCLALPFSLLFPPVLTVALNVANAAEALKSTGHLCCFFVLASRQLHREKSTITGWLVWCILDMGRVSKEIERTRIPVSRHRVTESVICKPRFVARPPSRTQQTHGARAVTRSLADDVHFKHMFLASDEFGKGFVSCGRLPKGAVYSQSTISTPAERCRRCVGGRGQQRKTPFTPKNMEAQ